MRAFESREELLRAFRQYGERSNGTITIHDADGLRRNLTDDLAYTSSFGSAELQADARWLIWQVAQALGCSPASIHEYYMAGGQGAWSKRTTPAVNVRGMAYDTARAVFRAANKLDVGQLIVEIARSEMGYTSQRPDEYSASMLAAAIREGFAGPVFIQGDHFQLNAKGYKNDPEKEVQGVRDLIDEAVAAGFLNIDIDSSTIVDLSLPNEVEQQADNARRTAQLTAHIREREPQGVTVSVGGEIGEVGSRNSTVEELHAFMRGYRDDLLEIDDGMAGISKISVQTGTSHGGVVLADGTIAKVKVDFDTLGQLSEVARREYKLAGAVQHGASTLPEEAFNRFSEANACEVHLATGFQNILYDSSAFPSELRDEMYAYLAEKHPEDRKPDMTDAQFYYTARKRALGPFKRQLWDLPEGVKEEISNELQERFELIFTRLNVVGTSTLVRQHTTVPKLARQMSAALSDVEVEGE